MPAPPLATPPQMLLPSPAPQNEAEGIQRGKDTPKFSFTPNPQTGKVGGPTETRIHPDATRHPLSRKFSPKGI